MSFTVTDTNGQTLSEGSGWNKRGENDNRSRITFFNSVNTYYTDPVQYDFTSNVDLLVQYVIVGGGGAGSSKEGGKGGSVVTGTMNLQKNSASRITVGTGGYRSPDNQLNGFNGFNGCESSFRSFTANGGAGGRTVGVTAGANGANGVQVNGIYYGGDGGNSGNDNTNGGNGGLGGGGGGASYTFGLGGNGGNGYSGGSGGFGPINVGTGGNGDAGLGFSTAVLPSGRSRNSLAYANFNPDIGGSGDGVILGGVAQSYTDNGNQVGGSGGVGGGGGGGYDDQNTGGYGGNGIVILYVALPPLKPTILSSTPTGNASASISFTPPINDGGSNITGYEYSIDSGATYLPAVVDASNTFVASGLYNNSTTNVYLRAVNAAGSSDFDSISVTLPPGPPSPPIVFFCLGGDKKINITFTIPQNDGGSVITQYEYSISPNPYGISNSTLYTVNNLQQIDSTTSRFEVTNLTNGTPYTIGVYATNSSGNSLPSNGVAIPLTTPDPPTNLSATVENGQTTISFTPPLNNGTSITYNYVYTINASPQTTQITLNSGSNSFTVTGLTNGTLYTFILFANIVGSELGSLASSAISVTPQASTVPDAPVITSGTDENISSTISFTPPENDGGATITGYEYSIDNGSNYFSAVVSNNSFVISGLTNGTQYTVVMRAVNASGSSISSNSVVVTPASVPDMNEASISQPTTGNGSITFTITHSNTSGAPILGYEYSTDGTNYSQLTSNANGSYTVSGLSNGSPSFITVTAINRIGTSNPSSSIVAIPSTVPDAPTTPTAVHGNGLATILFVPPANDGGNSITNYQFSISPGTTSYSSGVFYTCNLIGFTNSFSINGLTNGTQYTILLQAVNTNGPSSSSQPVVVIPSTIPNKPLNVSAIHGNTSATISFNTPDNGGNAISKYQFSISPGTPLYSNGVFLRL